MENIDDSDRVFSETNSEKVSTKRVARYRAKHTRIDYIPSEDVLDLIKRMQVKHPGWSLQVTIDALLRSAKTAIKDPVQEGKNFRIRTIKVFASQTISGNEKSVTGNNRP